MYIDPHLSWMKFNRRILELSQFSCEQNYKRFFLSISIGNLKEFIITKYYKIYDDKVRVPAKINDYGIANEALYNFIRKYIKSICSLMSDIWQNVEYNDSNEEFSQNLLNYTRESDKIALDKDLKYIILYKIGDDYSLVHVKKECSQDDCNKILQYYAKKYDTDFALLEFLRDYNEEKFCFLFSYGNRELIDSSGILDASDLKGVYIEHFSDLNFFGCSFNEHIGDGFLVSNNGVNENFISKSSDFFSVLNSGDLCAYHPYDSFDIIENFLSQAAKDENVISIKQTIYRINLDSKIISHLIDAHNAGKDVEVFIERRARFSEQINDYYIKKLESKGVKVYRDYRDYKVHSKFLLVCKKTKEEGVFEYYSHVSTGNYNAETARTYQDISFFSADEAVYKDLEGIFVLIKNNKDYMEFRDYSPSRIVFSPFHIRRLFYRKIDKLIYAAKEGGDCRLIIKCNALTDVGIIDALYKSSSAGVKLTCMVRGMCCMKPINNNISIKSTIGHFLEHSRIYYFDYDNGDDELYISSADLMPRNLDSRIEVMIKVQDEKLKSKILGLLAVLDRDVENSCSMDLEGVYEKCSSKNFGSGNLYNTILDFWKSS